MLMTKFIENYLANFTEEERELLESHPSTWTYKQWKNRSIGRCSVSYFIFYYWDLPSIESLNLDFLPAELIEAIKEAISKAPSDWLSVEVLYPQGFEFSKPLPKPEDSSIAWLFYLYNQIESESAYLNYLSNQTQSDKQ